MRLTHLILTIGLITSLVPQAMSAEAQKPTGTVQPGVQVRYANPGEETPDFQQHVIPMLSKLGCNGRACHGSFQGQGGFRLSLFGYDFKMDHEGLNDRIDTEAPSDSYAYLKATLKEEHEGGQVIVPGSWQEKLLLKWIATGAKGVETPKTLTQLKMEPAEIVFQTGQSNKEAIALKAIAIWSDGTQEDVTAITRFQTNDPAIAAIDQQGVVSSGATGDTHVVAFYDNAVVPVAVMKPVSGQQVEIEKLAKTEIDRHVLTKLNKLGVTPSEVCSDEEFLRRVSLDLAGTLPSPQEIRDFLADSSADKRQQKIDQLLESPAYAAWWTTKLCDFTGNTSNQLNNTSIANSLPNEQWYNWINKRVVENMAYDDIVRGLVLANSRLPGEDYREYCERMTNDYVDKTNDDFSKQDSMPYYWARQNFRKAEDRAIGFAYTFLGTRIQCAQCHKHPFDQWTQEDFKNFEPFFARTRFSQNGADRKEFNAMVAELGLEGKRGNQLRRELPALAKEGKTVPFPELVNTPYRKVKVRDKKTNKRITKVVGANAAVLGGETINLGDYKDPRDPLMEWLTGDARMQFAKAFVNRAWANYFHRGIVEPTDDMSLANPPSNSELLEYLAIGFIENQYDMKWVHREICNSETYQRSWKPNASNMSDERNFSRAVPRRLPAEIVSDAIVAATGKTEQWNEFRSEIDDRAIAMPETGQGRGRQNYMLTIFGKSARENNCDCEQSFDPSLLQTLYLNNDQELLNTLDNRRDSWMAELASQWNVKFNGSSKNSATKKRPKNYSTVVKRYRELIARAKKNDDQASLKKFKSKLNAYYKRYGKSSEPAENEAQTNGSEVAQNWAPPEGWNAFVETAYLRTLSRLPKEQEMTTSVEFLQQAKEPMIGVEDFLWALLNTKEFIVNH